MKAVQVVAHIRVKWIFLSATAELWLEKEITRSFIEIEELLAVFITSEKYSTLEKDASQWDSLS